VYESYLDHAARDVARALGIDPYYARWEPVADIKGQGLVLHLPWARVVVARSAIGAQTFIQGYTSGKNTWLLDALYTAYPIERTTPLHSERLLELPVSDKALAGFLRWGIRAKGRTAWPVSRDMRVVGSWTSYQDAILLRQRDGRASVRLRKQHHRLGATHGSERKDSHPGGAVPA